MPGFSATLDFALALVCVALALSAARAGNDFLFVGLAWIAAAAAVGGYRFDGHEWVAPTHDFLSRVGRGPATFAMGLGVLAALLGRLPLGRYAAHLLSVAGAALVHLAIAGNWPHLDASLTALGAVLLLALLAAVALALRRGRRGAAVWATAAIVLMLFAGFGARFVDLGRDTTIRWHDVLHVTLIVAYVSIWAAVRGASSAAPAAHGH